MPRELSCPHCLRPLRGAADGASRCPTCGRSLADDDDPRVARVRGGMRARRDDDDYDDYDDDEDLPRSKRGRKGKERPGKVQAIGIMTLIGGIIAVLFAINLLVVGGLSSFGLCCLWPGGYYSLVLGIMAIIKGSQLMGQDAHRLPPPKGTAIMMIINIINGDVANLAMGIIILVFCNDPEVENFFQGS